MHMPAVPQSVLETLGFLHVFLTFLLFGINLLFTHLITQDGFVARLKFLGHEMVYLAAGIVLSRIFTSNNKLAIVVALVAYILVWLLTIVLTKRVLELGHQRLNPLIGVTLCLGAICVLLALGATVETYIGQMIRPEV